MIFTGDFYIKSNTFITVAKKRNYDEKLIAIANIGLIKAIKMYNIFIVHKHNKQPLRLCLLFTSFIHLSIQQQKWFMCFDFVWTWSFLFSLVFTDEVHVLCSVKRWWNRLFGFICLSYQKYNKIHLPNGSSREF